MVYAANFHTGAIDVFDKDFHAATLTYDTSSEGATFSTDPLDEEIEITGPVAAKLWVSSDTTDADLFLVLSSKVY